MLLAQYRSCGGAGTETAAATPAGGPSLPHPVCPQGTGGEDRTRTASPSRPGPGLAVSLTQSMRRHWHCCRGPGRPPPANIILLFIYDTGPPPRSASPASPALCGLTDHRRDGSLPPLVRAWFLAPGRATPPQGPPQRSSSPASAFCHLGRSFGGETAPLGAPPPPRVAGARVLPRFSC